MSTFFARCKAPKLTDDRLNTALNHSYPSIRSLAQIVKEAKQNRKIPNAQDIPNKDFVNQIAAQADTLNGEERDAAFHMIWYVKELLLGRHPDA